MDQPKKWAVFLLTAALGLPGNPSAALQAAQDADFRPLLADAIGKKQPRVVIPPGTYRLAPAKGGAIVVPLKGAGDLEIVADGVTLVCTKRTRAWEFLECRNVTLRGLTIDYDPLTFTQGRIAAVADDAGWIDVRIDAGYPREPWSRIDLLDPATRSRKKGMPFLWGTRAELIPPDTVRVRLKGIGKAARVGDPVTLNDGNEPGGVCHGMTIERCGGGIALKDVTLRCAPGMGIVEAGGEGGTRLERVRIVPGPPPPGAKDPRMLTTSWDGILHTTVRRGAAVEDCVIEHCGDDSWSVQSQDYLILGREGASAVIAPRGDLCPLRTGDRLQVSLDTPAFRIASVEPVRPAGAALEAAVIEKLDKAQPWTLWKVNRNRWVRATFEGDPPWAAGQSLFSPDWQGNGFSFRGNRVRSPGRLLLKAGDGIVEGNTFVQPHAIVACPEVPDEAAAGIRNLVLRRNTIVESGYFCPAPWSSQAGAVSITCGGPKRTFRSPPVFADIVIEDNTFQGINGVNLVVASARGVSIRGNRFLEANAAEPNDTGAEYRIDQRSVVWLSACEKASLAGNSVERRGKSDSPALRLAADVKDVTGAETGILVKER